LLAEKLQLAPSPEEADIILVNTCAFIEDARTEAAETILRVCAHKTEGNCRAVVVTECMVQRYRERLKQAFPDVDAFLGVDELEEIAEVVRRVTSGQGSVMVVGDGASKRLFSPRLPALRFTGGPFAYLKVAEGCDHVCAFCAIPGIRGKFRSRGLDELVVESQALLDSGVKEINLISQDTTSYGMDRRDGARLADLLKALDGLKGDFWLRMLYGYSGRVTDAWLDVMAASRHICAYLDLPIQHSHPEILRDMRRADTVQAVAAMPDRLRKALPGVTLRTTCLVGFPGEKEEHFQHLLEYVEAARFDHLGVFVYSPEEGTVAFEQEDEPPPLEVAEERRDRLMQLQQRLVAERQQELMGQTVAALLLHPLESEELGDDSDVTWVARLPRQAPDVDGVTHVSGVPDEAKIGDFMRVRITGGTEYDLTADVVGR